VFYFTDVTTIFVNCADYMSSNSRIAVKSVDIKIRYKI
jgi:hypothetical protein